ncbi:MAG: hypothetical protein AB1505_30045, partial [Candidatus Latescibacterota bacterium]
MPEHRPRAEEPASEALYEKRDAAVPVIAKSAIALAVLLAVCGLLIHLLFGVLDRYEARGDRPVSPLAASRQAPPGPRLQVDPGLQKARLEEYEQEVLTTYGWADRSGRVARIPVSRAMELLATGR